MKYLEEYRDPERIRHVLAALHARATKPWTVMEVCGGQTHNIVRFGIDRLLPEGLQLIHGPGCPVCVTDASFIDQAIALAQTPNITLCSFGDMLRVPGSRDDLLNARASGGSVEVVYSPMDALSLAQNHPERQVVLFAVGFETTAPATAMAIELARHERVGNFSVMLAHVRVPPALEAIMATDEVHVHGFLAAGHVCTIMGTTEYEPIAARYQVPIVVTGFEPLDLVQGLYRCVAQLEEGSARVENQYTRLVRTDGNTQARALLDRVFEVEDRPWRGLGVIAAGGFKLRPPYREFDAAVRFAASAATPGEAFEPEQANRCHAGDVLRGILRPHQCPEFGRACTPDKPLGAPMVSSEGACAAYYSYREIS